MKVILGLLIMIICVPISKADSWLCAYEDDNVFVFFYDEFKRTKEGYKVWTKWVYTNPQKLDSSYYRYFKSYDEYNFDFDKSKCYKIVYYDKQGETVYSNERAAPSWSYLVPGSIGYAVADEIYNYINSE